MTQLGCPHCGTGLTGSFESCEFCGLDQADRDLLRVFLVSRGNMKELERHLGVSYPTARARFDDLLRKLDLGSPAPTTSGAAVGAAASGAGSAGVASGASGARLDVLRAVATGAVAVEAARDALGG